MKTPFLLILLVLLFGGCNPDKTKVDLTITGGTLIDVETGELQEGKTIIVQADSIFAVINNSEADQYAATVTMDAHGKFIIPGLWDMHVHFGGGDSLIQENKNLLPLYVANGITTVRDAAADISPSVLQWREEIAHGKLFGPTIFTSGPKLEGYQSMWIGDIEISTVEEMNHAIDSLQKMNVDFIKITDNTLKPDLYLEILREAKKRGIKTSSHIPASLLLEQVSEAGLGTVEHGSYLLKASSTHEKDLTEKIAAGKITYREALPEILATLSEEKALNTFSLLAKNGTAVVPTLNISYTTAYLDQQDHSNDGYQKYIGKGLLKTYNWRVERAANDNEKAIALRHESYEKTKTLLPWVQKSGMKIIAGTDAGYLNSFVYPGIALHQELQLFVEAGLTPLQALQSATINGPWFFGKLNKYGSLQAGKFADMLVLDENPLKDIKATQKISAVLLKGKLLDRKNLDSLLVEIAKKNE